MGQKVNPIGFRLALNKDWRSKWYASGRDYSDNLHSDILIRNYLKRELHSAAVASVIIERAWNSIRVTVSSARPGLVIGKKGEQIERMQAELSAMTGGKQVKIDIIEIKQPELEAQLIAENIALQLERRISFRRAMKRALQTAVDFGADGIRIRCAGRLGGADIARAERYREGKVPLQTLRVPIDYGFAEARTVYGIIGVKVWLNRGQAGQDAPAPTGPGAGLAQQQQRRERAQARGGRPGPGGRGGPGGGGRAGGRSGGSRAGGAPRAAAPETPAPAPAPAQPQAPTEA